jgi:phage protein D
MSATVLVSGVEVRLGGQPIDATLTGQALEIRVDTHLMLPDMFSMRIADPKLSYIDKAEFDVGTSVEVLFGAPDQRRLTSIFQGQITSLEPEFSADEVALTVRGYDRSHLLNRTRRTETYQSMSVADIARKVISNAKMTPGQIDSVGGALPFVQQSNETDWAFLWRLAEATGSEVVVDGREVQFRQASGEGTPVELRWGDELLSFRPRVTGARQVSEVVVRGWDPAQKQPIVASAKSPELTSQIGLSRSKVVSALGGGTVTVCDQPVASQAEATALAESIAGELANAYVEAEGFATGDPRLRAGTKVQITGVGSRFGGTYTLSEATHIFRTGRGYHTQLRVTGRSRRSLAVLSSPSSERTWRHSVVVGVVTNNDDPQGMGRVRVKYPTLDDSHEGWWARMTAPSAGAERGLLMLPRAGDEVLLAFEHDDDEHPYVIGAVWNGQGLPASLARTDGSFALRSDKSLVAQSVGELSLQGEANVGLQAGSEMALKATGNLSAETQADASLQATGSMTLKGAQSVSIQGSSQISIQGGMSTQINGGSQLALEAGGELQITGGSISIQASGAIQLSAPQIMLG